MRITASRLTLALLLALPALGHAEGPAGLWKHAEEPAWLEINFADGVGTGTVRRNDRFPERVGREVIKGLSAADTPGEWQGEIFVERMGEFRDVVVTLPAADQLQFTVKVGFMRRSIEWMRV